jgi:nitrite reductase (NADH) small subunit
MPNFVRVAAAAEIPPGHARAVVVGDREIAVFNVDGHFHAIDGICPHQGGPLAEGWIEGTVVTCPWHAWSFDVRTGKMTLLGDFCEVDTFDVRVVGSDVEVASDPRASVA